MHPNPIYREATRAQNIDFARARAFGVLAVNAPDGPLVSHIPFCLDADGSRLEAHLVRSNPILRGLAQPVAAVMAVSGGDTYISPDWYGMENQVPTWNYVAVHLRGTLRRLDDGEMHRVLERLSADFESRLGPKKPWTIGKMEQDIYGRLLRQIVPIAMDITDIDGTWKLAQNKPAPARQSAASAAQDAGFGLGAEHIAALMLAVEGE